MLRSVRIVDDFLPAEIFAAQKRDFASARWEKVRFRNLDYRGICSDKLSDPTAFFFARHGMQIRLRSQFFRIYEKDTAQNTFIHYDTVLAGYAAILSLAENDRYNGHLAFWRHGQTGWEEVIQDDEVAVALTEQDGMVEDRWELTELIELLPNRCIIFPTKRFHSRYPKIWQEPWPRKIKVYFFDLESNVQLNPSSRTKEIGLT